MNKIKSIIYVLFNYLIYYVVHKIEYISPVMCD